MTWSFAIDRGGTFTDVYAIDESHPENPPLVMKLLSEDPKNYPDAPREAIRRVLNKNSNNVLEKIDANGVNWIRMGTTVATNALLERKGEKIALVITAGFSDLLLIGNQARPEIFDLSAKRPEVLYSKVVEIEERVITKSDKCEINDFSGKEVVEGITGEKFIVEKSLDEVEVKTKLQQIFDSGIKSLAVVFMHSYSVNKHEEMVEHIAKKIGFSHISLSSKIMPMVKAVPRGLTACVDAYLTPCIKKYLSGFCSGFENLNNSKIQFMQSDGGLTEMQNFNGSRAILSGPAGGVVGYAMTTVLKDTNLPVIGFDMGGTSTDVSRFSGKYEHVFETTTAGVTIQAPQLDINTVAAGGGSRLFYRAGLLVVGPESAGSEPGPVCYRKTGGLLAVTDANLALGRLMPKYFPKIFGPNKNEGLDRDSSVNQLKCLSEQTDDYTWEELAQGFLDVANETMCRPIRAITQAKGYDTSKHILATFGGAGGQHCCSIARSLGMSKVFIHKYAGILSAYGMALANVVHEEQVPCALNYKKKEEIMERSEKLRKVCQDKLMNSESKFSKISSELFLHMRFEKTDFGLMVSEDELVEKNDFETAFMARYKAEFGFVLKGREILIDDIRVRGTGHSEVSNTKVCEKTEKFGNFENTDTPNTHRETTTTYFGKKYKWIDTKVYFLDDLTTDFIQEGPMIIMNGNSTIVVEPECTASITDKHDVIIDIKSEKKTQDDSENAVIACDAIQLSIFGHRFMSIAEQMGRRLQRTAISTNIKERLDFSCALFGEDGGLVSNAPHIPVHLGAMQKAVMFQIEQVKRGKLQLNKGDVILSNHPMAGGSHLPDLTVITPVFNGDDIIFFTANRGHHADIGGSTPGSMPSNSQSLMEEGAQFISFKIVESGNYRETKLIEKFNEPGKYPGCSGSRNLKDNIADLAAQISANQRGIELVGELIQEYGLRHVQAYMKYIQDQAEKSVRELLKSQNSTTMYAEDFMDDGTKICLTIKVDPETGDAVFDFEGTDYQVLSNLNAPVAVTYSAVIYCLRCLVSYDIPLNQGCLTPVTIKLPENSILNPSNNAAVVGGNVLTSQRVVDVILKAFQKCAASQGCMNNVTFGDETSGYYETVCGGIGAGQSYHGAHGTHSHMTNTRITDVEIIERRYPVIVDKFKLRENSGGKGAFRGGDGVQRMMRFRKPLHLSILTERRVFSPYGMAGGENGWKGANVLHRNGQKWKLTSRASVSCQTGDVFELLTPGGGGYGKKT